MSWNLFISLTQRDISIEERYCYPEQKVIHLALIFSKDIKARSEIAKSILIISISLWVLNDFRSSLLCLEERNGYTSHTYRVSQKNAL